MLIVKSSQSKDIYNVYDVCINNNFVFFLLYDKNRKQFEWFHIDNFKPHCKELFKIFKKSHKRIKANVYFVHCNHGTRFLIYNNKAWDWVQADEYEIISLNEIN